MQESAAQNSDSSSSVALTEGSDEDLLHYGEEEYKEELEPDDEQIYLIFER